MTQDTKALLAALMAARAALNAICNIQEERCERYVAVADILALDALIALDSALDDAGLYPITFTLTRSCA